MPIYEYQCLECGKHYERLQRFGDSGPVHCPAGHEQVQRLFSQPTIIFKGSGFYVTDNRRNGSTATSGTLDKSKKKSKDEDKKAAAASQDESS
jgi:putative FmdB family regulatory protein